MTDHGRQCDTCGGHLSRYNHTGRCGACDATARAAPSTVQVPPHLWQHDDVRDALGRWDWATVFTAVIDATGATQHELADATGLSQAHVSRLATGKGHCYDIRAITRIIDGLGAPRRFAGLAPDHDGSGGPGDHEEVSAMQRRRLLAASAAAPFAAALRGIGGHVSPDQAQQARQLVPQLFALDDRHGGTLVAEIAASCTRQVDRLLANADYSEATGRLLRIAHGELAEMSGWLHFDAGQLAQAEAGYAKALQAAHLADDLNLEVLVLASMSMLARTRGRPRDGVQLAQLAQRRASGWATPRLASLLAAREAVCWAQQRDAAAASAAMRRAAHTFRPEVDADDPAWIDFYDAAELTAHRATAAAYLGRHDQAVDHFRTVLDGLRPEFQRNRAMYTVRLGQHLLALGDEAGACTTVDPVLPLLTEVRSGRAHASFAQLHAVVADSRDAAARHLIDHARHLNLPGQRR